MSSQNEPHASVWMQTERMPAFHPLAEDTWADVCVVGAGIAGMTTAYLLARAGKSVVVLEAGPLGSGETRKTTAHLSNAIDDRFIEIEKVHGQEGSRLAADSHTAAIDRIERISREENIDCDFLRLDGYLFLAPRDTKDLLEKELAAAHRAGLKDVEMMPRAPLSAFDTGPCLRFPRQGQFHPLKYLAGLARGIEKYKGRIFTGSEVGEIHTNSQVRIRTKRGPTVTAGAVVVATNTPINDWVAIHTKQAPYMSYAIGMPIPRGSVTPALYWDTQEFYHYIRIQPLSNDLDCLIVGGEDHKVGQAHDQEERWQRLRQWAVERFPMAGNVEHKWSGMVMETTDGLGFIGRNPGDKDNVYIATGDSGMGMTHGTIAGMLLTDLILERDNPWSKIYDPSRKPVWGMAWREYLSENLNVAAQYVKDWLGPGEASSTEQIQPGHGAIVRRGLHRIAAYRSETGEVHECSAVCTHLGCVVHWNDAEKSWDCPCHGSRFAPTGEVTHGPAIKGLEQVRDHEKTST